MRILRWLPSLILLVPLLFGPQLPANATRIRDLASPTSFHLVDWETQHLAEQAGNLWSGLTTVVDPTASDVDVLRTYFADRAHHADLRPLAETALEHVVATAYREDGVNRDQPIRLAGLFPPVLVALTQPPNVLVIAPRTELRVMSSSVLESMDVAAQEQLEASADSTGVSSLVTPIGGLATYPSMVLENDSAELVLSSVAHEWLHQYLIFYPLGAGYWSSQETREINETTADLVGNEVGAQAAASIGLAAPPSQPGPRGRPAFDFRGFMRDTRDQTEQLLAAGQVDAAEAYMRARRDELQQHGYVIRKLNQAYFALYGSYGDGFAASPRNPIPGLLHTLRQQSPSLADFLVRVRGVTSVADLRQAVAGSAGQQYGFAGVVGQ
jgi:hypothetical protein